MKQKSLFEGQDNTSVVLLATPAISGDHRTLSPTQRRFNTLLKQIDTLRQEQRKWQTFMDGHHQRVATVLLPELAQLRASQIELARLLDFHVTQSKLTKRDREITQEWLISLLDELLSEEQTPELVALYEAHTGMEEQSDVAALDLNYDTLRLMASALRVDVDAYQGAPDPKEFSDWVEEQLFGWNPSGDRSGGRPDEPQAESKGRARKSKAAKAKSAPKVDEGALTLRKLFRNLASALHPDRESDPTEQKRKTVLMQELNAAYAAGDLLKILELQHGVDARTSVALQGLTDEQLKPYIQLLNARLKTLKQELDALLAPIMAIFPGCSVRSLTTAQIEISLDREVADVKRVRQEMQTDTKHFAVVEGLKAFLAQMRREMDGPRRAARRSASRRRGR